MDRMKNLKAGIDEFSKLDTENGHSKERSRHSSIQIFNPRSQSNRTIVQ
jgi:hypothetical protein